MIYVIKQGQHQFKPNNFNLDFVVNDTEFKTWECLFGSTCSHDLPYPESLQVNKLAGYAKIHHHLESLRLGYRWNKETQRMDLFPYYYYKGKRTIATLPITSVRLDKYFRVSMTIRPNSYKLYVGKNSISTPSNFRTYIGYELGPYFGGKIPAPHDMTIQIDNV